MTVSNDLYGKIKDKNAKIAIIGLGYVGLPLLLRFKQIGFSVLGLDIDEGKVEKLHRNESYIEHIPASALVAANDEDWQISSDFSLITEADAIIICVPTPLNKYREPDISYVTNTMELMAPYLRAGQIISLESTTYPGTTEEELFPRIEKTGLTVGEDIFLIYSPEREDPGNPDFETQTIPKVVGGHCADCLKLGTALYEQAIDKVVPVSSTKAAEMTKLLENIHRAVNIGLVNEMKIVADKMGINIFEVIDAAATKPFGFTPYYPGPGLGGHCIPIDPFYLTWKAREYGIHTRFIELSGEINQKMPQYVVDKLDNALNDRGLPLKDAKILILGIAYKRNVDDMRESPSVEIMELLRDKGCALSYSDPHVPKFKEMRDHHFDLASVTLTPKSVGEFDAVLLATDHAKFDYEMIKANAKLIIDTRGKYDANGEKIVRA